MSNLVTALGRPYMNDWFDRACFAYNGKLYRWGSIEDNRGITCFRYDMPEGNAVRVKIPFDEVKGFSFFKFPPLGYRNFASGERSMVAETTSSRSARRGLSRQCVQAMPLPVFSLVTELAAIPAMMTEAQFMDVIFFPKYIPFHEGIKEVLEGKSAGFAVSAHIAVVIDIEARRDPHIIILYRGKRAGFVSSTGEVVLTNKVVSRSALREALK